MRTIRRGWLRSWRERRSVRALVHESEAFLMGRYGAELGRRHRRVPSWTVLNVVAHADMRRLSELAAAPGASIALYGPGVRSIARDVLAASGRDPRQLSELQARVLVPLELHLIEMSQDEPLSEFEIVAYARAAIGQWW